MRQKVDVDCCQAATEPGTSARSGAQASHVRDTRSRHDDADRHDSWMFHSTAAQTNRPSTNTPLWNHIGPNTQPETAHV